MRAVAHRSSVSLGHISEIERGIKEGSSELWDSIAFGLGVSFSEIVTEAGWRMSGVRIPDTVQELDEYADLMVR
jgi:transcriptional regulator with XRE-family HTH domain